MSTTTKIRPAPFPRITESEIRTTAACRAFWSDHPLNRKFREHVGMQVFNLAAFIAWTKQLEQDEFNACMFAAGLPVH